MDLIVVGDFVVNGDFVFYGEASVTGNVSFQGGTIDLQNSIWDITGNLTATGGTIFDVNCWDGTQWHVTGDFNFIGYSGDELNLRGNEAWYLNVGGNSLAQYLNVEYSDASGGNTIIANNGTSTDYGNNHNWLFGGELVDVDFEFTVLWDTNTDKLPSYWYQVEGICFNPIIDDCTNLPTNMNTGCQSYFIRTILAKNLEEVCDELEKEKWNWPIKSIKRWSRPAENKFISPSDTCNVLEDVANTDICGFTNSKQ
jgi:hypothetical protein